MEGFDADDTIATVISPDSRELVLPAPAELSLDPGARVGERYVITELLGRGGFGEVYRVLDEAEARRPLALKLHRFKGRSPEALEALRGEFSLLASLRHPHLAVVHDFGQIGDEVAFFTQDLVAGVPLHRAGLPLTSERTIRLVGQLARALDYLHSRGVLHGDVKPSNVLVDLARDHVTLLDFGIARAFGTPERGRVAGTFGYLAPEVFGGESLDGRVDLYALGVTLYRLAVGHPPFRGAPTEIVRAQLVEGAPPLPEGALPPPLTRLVERLLCVDPAGRPASAAELLAELAEASGVSLPHDTSDSLASFVLSARAIGLDAPRDALVRRTQSAGPIVVIGEGGTGKSRLLREARHRVQLSGRQWISVTATRASEGHTVISDLAGAVLTSSIVERISEEDRIELARTMPELRRSGERIAVALDPERASRARMAALLRAVDLRFERGGGVVAIEDLHWAEGAALERVLALLELARAASTRAAFVLTARSGSEAEGRLRALSNAVLETTSLAPEASRALVEATFGSFEVIEGTELAADLARGPASALCVQESLRLAIERGAVVRRAGRWQRAAPLPALELDAVLVARISLLDPDARDLARAAAVLRRSSSLADLAAMVGKSVEEGAEPLGRLVRSGIVEHERDARGASRYAMHDRFVDAVLSSSDARALAALGRRAAERLERSGSDWRAWREAAAHRRRTGDAEGALRSLRRGAEIAAAAGRPDVAVELLEREADERAAIGEVPIELWLRVLDQAMVGGLGDKAAAALSRLRAARPSDRERVEIALREARAHAARGEADEARSRCREAREEARRLGVAAAEVELTLVEADVESRHGDAKAGAALYAGAAVQARALGDAALEARAHLGASVVAMYLGNNAGVHDHALAALVAAQRSGDPVLTSESQRALGNAHRERGELVDSLRCYENAVRTARASGAIENEAKALNNFGVDATRLGRLSDAVEAYRRAIRLKERLGAEASADVTRNNLAYLLGAIGDHEEAKALLEAIIARATGNAGELIARANLAELAVHEGRVDEGVMALEAADAISEQRGLTQFRGQLGAALARALTMRGAPDDLSRAEAILESMASYADQAPTEQGRYAVAKALLWDRRGEHARAEVCARDAVSHGLRGAYLFGCLGSRLEALWVHAVSLGRLGRAAEASELASRALLTLTWLGESLGGEAARRRMMDASALHRTIRAARLDVPVGHSWHPEA